LGRLEKERKMRPRGFQKQTCKQAGVQEERMRVAARLIIIIHRLIWLPLSFSLLARLPVCMSVFGSLWASFSSLFPVSPKNRPPVDFGAGGRGEAFEYKEQLQRIT
jgi:hypothetical protein